MDGTCSDGGSNDPLRYDTNDPPKLYKQGDLFYAVCTRARQQGGPGQGPGQGSDPEPCPCAWGSDCSDCGARDAPEKDLWNDNDDVAPWFNLSRVASHRGGVKINVEETAKLHAWVIYDLCILDEVKAPPMPPYPPPPANGSGAPSGRRLMLSSLNPGPSASADGGDAAARRRKRRSLLDSEMEITRSSFSLRINDEGLNGWDAGVVSVMDAHGCFLVPPTSQSHYQLSETKVPFATRTNLSPPCVGGDRFPAVSYTHLTLPTILLV